MYDRAKSSSSEVLGSSDSTPTKDIIKPKRVSGMNFPFSHAYLKSKTNQCSSFSK
jgi:hypothetical protein